MSNLPVVSIVVVNYNGLQHLQDCLPSITKTQYSNFEVILVDNGSTDRSVEFVKRNFPSINIVRCKRNSGAAGGYNIGILHAKGKYVVILNNDVEVDLNWLSPLVELMEKFPNVGAVDPKYLDYYDRKKFDSAAAAGRFIDFAGNCFTRGADEEDTGQYDKVARVFTCCTMFRRDVLSEVGLFDPDFFYGFEDTDLSWRIMLRGYQILYVPSSRIYHKVGGTTLTKNPSCKKPRHKKGYYYLWKRNKLLLLLKNYSGKNILRAMPLAFLETLGYICYWTVKRDKQYSFETVKGTLWVLRNFNKIWAKHKFVQSLRRVNDTEIMKIMAPYSGDIIKFVRVHIQ
jgi:hypothetical protein